MILEGNELNVARFSSEADEFFMFGTFADDGERKFEINTGFDGKVETLPVNLARSGNEAVTSAGFYRGRI